MDALYDGSRQWSEPGRRQDTHTAYQFLESNPGHDRKILRCFGVQRTDPGFLNQDHARFVFVYNPQYIVSTERSGAITFEQQLREEPQGGVLASLDPQLWRALLIMINTLQSFRSLIM